MTERDESSSDQWTEVGDLLAKLYAIVARLEALFATESSPPTAISLAVLER